MAQSTPSLPLEQEGRDPRASAGAQAAAKFPETEGLEQNESSRVDVRARADVPSVFPRVIRAGRLGRCGGWLPVEERAALRDTFGRPLRPDAAPTAIREARHGTVYR
jgi:hypothetical protein